MWSGGEEYNYAGETVRLYQPILYGRKPIQSDLTASFVGGCGPIGQECAPTRCALCQETTQHLAQLHVPQKGKIRTYSVFACNSAACFNKLFDESPLLVYGGRGVVVCRRVTTATHEKKCNQQSDVERSSMWADEQTGKDDDDEFADWEVDESKDMEVRDLEVEIAAIETSAAFAPASKPAFRKKGYKRHVSLFPCFELHALQEPQVRITQRMDDEDVGVLAAGSDDKIRQMLAKYMAEEEDESILAVLRGSVDDCAVSGGGKSIERDERLCAEDKALLAYTDRLKRSPRQVIRYAYGGVPLWSIPPPVPKSELFKVSPRRPRATQQTVPPCSCGAPRTFEFQLLSSLLHVLQVDQFSTGNLESAYTEGGMNWGNIAVYTCSETCSSDLEEYVVIQESTEGRPTNLQRLPEEPVVIAEGTYFTHDDDDDDDDDRSNDGDMDDEESSIDDNDG